MPADFPLKLGEGLKKKEIHQLVGGSEQHAMTTCLGGRGFLVFHDPIKGKKFGYDRWEGAQVDGTFHYTGQGVIGDQLLRGPNKSLLQTVAKGSTIHFFTRPEPGVRRGLGNPYFYRGTVALAENPYEVKTAPDETGTLRKVLVFHLVPINANFLPREKQAHDQEPFVCEFLDWKVSADVAILEPYETSSRQIILEENQLHQRFYNQLSLQGEKLERFTLSSPELKGRLSPDFVIRKRKLVVEAKPSVSRAHVRLAIGQVLDYSNLMKNAGLDFKPALLFPRPPSADLVELIHGLGIVLITEEKDGTFRFAES